MIVTKRKFVYLTHSEAKQTKTLKFGAEEGLLQGHARRMGYLCLKNSKLLKGFSQSIFFFSIFLPRSMRDLSSPSRDRTRAPCNGSTVC